mmetsp:Transcript_13432/g.39092  ORF Transcript_13432/g.39092 Transcript_13432/m.39092 type:complete len:333 (+) Transcript_13432:661-1659(+)
MKKSFARRWECLTPLSLHHKQGCLARTTTSSGPPTASFHWRRTSWQPCTSRLTRKPSKCSQAVSGRRMGATRRQRVRARLDEPLRATCSSFGSSWQRPWDVSGGGTMRYLVLSAAMPCSKSWTSTFLVSLRPRLPPLPLRRKVLRLAQPGPSNARVPRWKEHSLWSSRKPSGGLLAATSKPFCCPASRNSARRIWPRRRAAGGKTSGRWKVGRTSSRQRHDGPRPWSWLTAALLKLRGWSCGSPHRKLASFGEPSSESGAALRRRRLPYRERWKRPRARRTTRVSWQWQNWRQRGPNSNVPRQSFGVWRAPTAMCSRRFGRPGQGRRSSSRP